MNVFHNRVSHKLGTKLMIGINTFINPHFKYYNSI